MQNVDCYGAFLLVIYSICPFAGARHLSFLRNRASIVEKSIHLMLMMTNTVNDTVNI